VVAWPGGFDRCRPRMSIASTDISADATDARLDVGAGAAPSVRAYVSNCRWTLLGTTLAVVGVFLPTVIVPYAFSDDYTDLYMADGWGGTAQFGKNIIDASAITGRVFSGLLIQWFFAAAGTIENLRFVRLVAVITIAALALLLHWALVRAGFSAFGAALVAVLLCTLPAFQVYASWAVLFSSPLAALLAGAASLFTVSAVDGPRQLERDRYLGAVFLVVAALLIYQPAAMFFWVFFAIALVGAARQSRRSLRLVEAHFGVGFAALALAYVDIKVTVLVMGNSTTGAARNTLSHDVVGKTRWFVHQPLYRSLNVFDLTPTPWFAALVAVVSASGIVLWLLRRGARPLLYVGVGLVLIPLTYLPNLVVTDMWPAYRTQVAINALIALYLCLGAIGLWGTFGGWLKPRVGADALVAFNRAALGLAVVFVVTSVATAARNVTTLFVLPHMTEQRLLRSRVAALPDGAARIAFIQTDWYGGATRQVVYDEFGLPSSTRQWTLEPAVDLILNEEGRLAKTGPRPPVEVWPSWTTTSSIPKGEPVIDLRELSRLR
jgi:hypothetical protein